MKEGTITIAIFGILALLALTSWAGLLLAIGWLGVGAWMVKRTASRGILGDISFLATWPLYVITGR